MKSSQVFFLSIFISTLICGFWLGTNLRRELTLLPSKELALSQSRSTPTQASDQKNFLIITANNINQTNSRLMSIWLVTYFLDNPSVTFKPIYPGTEQSTLANDEALASKFQIISINSQPRLSGTFLNALSENDLWWNGYILIDRQVLSRVLDLPSSLLSSEEPLDDQDQVLTSPDSTAASLILNEESLVIQEFCDRMSRHEFLPNWENIRNLIPDSIYADLDAERVFSEWDAILRKEVPPLCLLPLEVLSPVGETK